MTVNIKAREIVWETVISVSYTHLHCLIPPRKMGKNYHPAQKHSVEKKNDFKTEKFKTDRFKTEKSKIERAKADRFKTDRRCV